LKFRELYLDTTYVMPFFHLDIDVKGFSRSGYKEIIKSLDKIHLNEISLIEAKAKSLKIREKQSDVNKKFNEGLSVLSDDDQVMIHGYGSMDDAMFNEFILLGLDFFDAVILAQSCTAGNLLTEDLKLLQLKDTGVNIINWAALQTGRGV